MSDYIAAERSLPYEGEGSVPAQYSQATIEGVSAHDLAQQILVGMQNSIEAQVDWRLKQQTPAPRAGVPGSEIAVILGSIGIGIPLMGIAAASAGLAGVITICIMLIAVNGVWAGRR